MTWKEFCESEYNVNNFTAYEDAEVYTYEYDDGMGDWGYNEWGWIALTPDDYSTSNSIISNQIIIADTTYYEQWDSYGIGGIGGM